MPETLSIDFFSQHYKKLAELLSAKPISVIELSNATQHSLFDTFNFCNACSALELTENTTS
jgi:hypothetical protein